MTGREEKLAGRRGAVGSVEEGTLEAAMPPERKEPWQRSAARGQVEMTQDS